jgi:hypothetical protein
MLFSTVYQRIWYNTRDALSGLREESGICDNLCALEKYQREKENKKAWTKGKIINSQF